MEIDDMPYDESRESRASRPAERKAGRDADLVTFKDFFRFIDNIVFIFNNILNYQFFNSIDVSRHICFVKFVLFINW